MPDKRFIAPRPGLEPTTGLPYKVLCPKTEMNLLPDGEWREMDAYWLRRLETGDVVELTPPDEA